MYEGEKGDMEYMSDLWDRRNVRINESNHGVQFNLLGTPKVTKKRRNNRSVDYTEVM